MTKELNPIIAGAFEVDNDGKLKLKYGFNSGGYENHQYFVTKDALVLAVEDIIELFNDDNMSFQDPEDDYYVTNVHVNYEHPEMYSDHTGERIDPAYDDDKMCDPRCDG